MIPLALAANTVPVPIPGGFSWTTLLVGVVLGIIIDRKIGK